MNPWGYIALGLGCAVVAGVLFGIAQPSDLDFAVANARSAFGENADAPHVNSGLMFVGYVFAAAASIATLIGCIGEGVRIGNRESD